MPSKQVWVVLHPEGWPICESPPFRPRIAMRRRDAVELAETWPGGWPGGRDWDTMRRQGYRCVKATLTWEKEGEDE